MIAEWQGLTTYHSVHLKDAKGNQPRKGSRKDISGIKNRDPSRKLLASVESCKDIQRTRVIRCLSNAQEEAREQQTGIVVTQRRQATDDGPDRHTGRHPDTGPDASNDHVRWNTDDDIACKEDRNAGLILGAGEVEVLLDGVESSEGDGISVLRWSASTKRHSMKRLTR